MEVIRFRAWDAILKEHLPNIQNHLGNDEWSFGNMLNNSDRFIIEQFTGLTDKNGKEIYEGDILSYEGVTSFGSKITRTVHYDNNRGQFMADMYSVYQATMPNPTVIGNIHKQGNDASL